MPMTLTVTAGPMEGKVFAFDEHDTFIFGRAKAAHCRITGDKAVSRHHFLLEVNPPHAQIKDLGSTNGVVVNDTKYGGRKGGAGKTAQLKDGDTVRVGKTSFVIQAEAEDLYKPTEVTPAAEAPDAAAEGGEEPGTGDMLRDMVAEVVSQGGLDGAPSIPGYQVSRKLGEGGMGAVYLGTRAEDGDEVAIKVMLPRVAVDEHAKKAFHREIAVTRDFEHPNIIRFFDDGFVNNMFYLVLEYVSGGDLQALTKSAGGKVSYKEAVPLMLQALTGLAYAHEQGYVHRDIKPQNILLDIQGGKRVAKVSDLGLAKNFDRAGLSGFTATGAAGGTPAYMPKEQIIDFKRARPSSDVFSMGATFYNMLTGSYVYNFEKYDEAMIAILEGDVCPIAERDPSLPRPLAKVIDKALAPEMDERFQDADEMRQALKRILR